MKNKEHIICAAVIVNDGKYHTDPPDNVETGFVVCGRRHNNCYAITEELLYPNWRNDPEHNKLRLLCENRKSQGFMTSTNRYVDREEAYAIARDADQLLLGDYQKSKPYMLASEDLY